VGGPERYLHFKVLTTGMIEEQNTQGIDGTSLRAIQTGAGGDRGI